MSFSAYKYFGSEQIESFGERQIRISNQVNLKSTTWQSEIYQRWQFTSKSQIKYFIGASDQPATPASLSPAEEKISQGFFGAMSGKYPTLADLPKNFKVADNWPECPTVKEISDQSQCGSAWAVSSANCMTDRICIHSQGIDNRKISAVDIMSCCSACGSGCDGGVSWIAFKQWVIRGYVTGAPYGDKNTCRPYPFPPCAHNIFSETLENCANEVDSADSTNKNYFDTPKCEHACIPSYSKNYWDDLVFGKAWYTFSGESNMMKE